jgi:hypothetical protein
MVSIHFEWRVRAHTLFQHFLPTYHVPHTRTRTSTLLFVFECMHDPSMGWCNSCSVLNLCVSLSVSLVLYDRTVLALAGKDFAIIAGDTRLSEGYSIHTRMCPRVKQLCVPFWPPSLHPVSFFGRSADVSFQNQKKKERETDIDTCCFNFGCIGLHTFALALLECREMR